MKNIQDLLSKDLSSVSSQSMNLNSCLDKYAEYHRDPTNVALHHLCIPLIGWSVLAFAHTFKVNESLSVAHVMALLTLIGYLYFKSSRLILVILICQLLSFLSFEILPSLLLLSVIGFILGWVGQLYGHKLEGAKPAFNSEIVFILIGPIWVFRRFL